MTEKKEKMRSRISGRAQVVFGGGVCVSFGTVGDGKDAFAIGLSEFKYPAKRAGEEPSSDETWGVQVSLVFPDLATLDNFRDALCEVEAELKKQIKDEESQQPPAFNEGEGLV